MTQELVEWLEKNHISYQSIGMDRFKTSLGVCLEISNGDEPVLRLSNNPHIDIQPHHEQIILRDDTIEYVVFEFGSRFYYTPVTDLQIKKLKPFRYIGEVDWGTPITDNRVTLGIHGKYELMCGLHEYEDWIEKARFLGYHAVGLCEKNTLAGAIQFSQACKKKDIKPIIGTYITCYHDQHPIDLKLYAATQQGWENLLEINTFKKQIPLHILIRSLQGVIVVIVPSLGVDKSFIEEVSKEAYLTYYQFTTTALEYDAANLERLDNMKWFIRNSQHIKPILDNDYYCLEEDQQHLKGILIKQSGRKESLTTNHFFKPYDYVVREFSEFFEPDDLMMFRSVINSTRETWREIIECVEFEIDTKSLHLPAYEMLEQEQVEYGDKESLFKALINQGLSKIDFTKHSKDLVLERVAREGALIKRGGFIDYFLILWDIVRYCKESLIEIGPGRGSAAGSLISYLLGITKVNPLEYDLLFERFLNESRLEEELPDVDIDVASDRREEVLEFMRDRYGYNYICQVGTYGTLKLKSALKELNRYYKVMNPEDINYLAKLFSDEQDSFFDIFKTISSTSNKRLIGFVREHYWMLHDVESIIGSLKNSSIHACATIIAPKNGRDIVHQIPLRVTEEGTYVSEWEGEELASAGYLKEDILSTFQMAKVGNMIRLIKEHHGIVIKTEEIPLDDHRVYDLFCQGYNEDVFHFGSSGLTTYLKHLQPTKIQDLIAAIALYRPGAMASDSHMEFIKLKNGEIEPEYDYMLQEVTQNTYGLYIYQEQIMKAVQVLGGFTLTEADGVRKAMGKKIQEKMDSYEVQFLKNAVEKGCPEDEAAKIWNKLQVFSSYGFNKCISGEERIYRVGLNKTGGSTFNPTIEEMFLIKNNREYAKMRGKLPLYDRYNNQGYGTGFSLTEEGLLKKNRILDIRDEGTREVFCVTLENGAQIEVTDNHKFPTSTGEKRLRDIDKAVDKLYFNTGHQSEDTGYRFTTKGSVNERYHTPSEEEYELNSKKGHSGFTKKGSTSYKKYEEYLLNHKKDYCEKCQNKDMRLEIHHIDEDHGNNELENLQTLCASCHKKVHYKNGRTRMGEKGLSTELIRIISIESVGEKRVFDVEMDSPNHTFVTQKGIVTCNSHAGAYAIIGYMCNWFKVNYPLEFWITAFEFAKEDDIPELLAEVNTISDVKVSPPEINSSTDQFEYDIESKTLFWDLNKIKFVGGMAVDLILKERKKNGQFFSIDEFVYRIENFDLTEHEQFKVNPVNKRVVEMLVLAGAFDDLHNITDKNVFDRFLILQRYYQTRKEDVPEVFSSNKESLHYWSLQQYEACKFSILDYKRLLATLPEFTEHTREYLDGEAFNVQSSKRTALVIGLLDSYEIRTTKRGDSFALLKVLHNSHIINVRVWPSELNSDDDRLRFDYYYRDSLVKGTLENALPYRVNKIVVMRGNLELPDQWKSHNELVLSPHIEGELIKFLE